MARCECNSGSRQQHGSRTSNEHRLAPADSIREPAEQGTTNYPSQWNKRTGNHGFVKAEHPVALKEGDPPGHVADRRWDKQESCHCSAKIRLRISKYDRVRP